MLKKLKLRFIVTSSLAFFIIMVLIITGINVVAVRRLHSTQDQQLQGIYEYSSASVTAPGFSRPNISDMPWNVNPGGEFTLRFFVLRCDSSGRVLVFNREYISSIDEETAAEYASDVLGKSRESGNYLDYRFLVKDDGDSTVIVFLNTADSNVYRSSLLKISLFTGFGSFALAVLLLILFSGKAVQPYVRNIEQQKQFITDAGHELKTPVTSITTSADILQMENPDNEWVLNIKNQSERLSGLIGNLVLLSRLDEETPFPEKTEFSLSDAIWETVQAASIRAGAEEKTFETDIDDSLPYRGDRQAIQKMLSTLLDNAIRYSDAGKAIFVSARKLQKKTCIEITNFSSTADCSHMDRWFDRFYRPDASRSVNSGGSGIGLSIVKSVAENHGGTVEVAKTGINGIRFRILL